jgi:hypothetical protein
MLAQHGARVIPVDNVSLPPRLNLLWLFRQLQRYKFHEACDHFHGAQHSQFLKFIFSITEILVVGEIWPQGGILCKEAHYLEALIIKALVHVTSALKQHHLNLTLRRLEGKDASDNCSEDNSQYSGYRCDDCWIH